MKPSIKKGFGFGLTSGIITTLGLIVGLHASTKSALAVIGGIIVIAIADSMSDAMGMHISEEFNIKKSKREIWEATFSTFFFKFIFAMTFIFSFLLLSLSTAIIVSILWGLLLISIFSFYIAKINKQSPHKVILEHLTITILVIIATHYIGELVRACFGRI
ncbi:MAG: hypothetical protein ABIB79_01575 [archaeon]